MPTFSLTLNSNGSYILRPWDLKYTSPNPSWSGDTQKTSYMASTSSVITGQVTRKIWPHLHYVRLTAMGMMGGSSLLVCVFLVKFCLTVYVVSCSFIVHTKENYSDSHVHIIGSNCLLCIIKKRCTTYYWDQFLVKNVVTFLLLLVGHYIFLPSPWRQNHFCYLQKTAVCFIAIFIRYQSFPFC